MKEYWIKFEIFGKRMKFKAHLLNPDRAKQKIADQIIIHGVEEVEQSQNVDDIFDLFRKSGLNF